MKKINYLLFALIILLLGSQVVLLTRISRISFIFDNEIKSIDQFSFAGIDLFRSEFEWNIPEFLEVREGQIFFTALDAEIHKITNISTKALKTHIVEQTADKITLVYSIPMASGGTKIEQVILFPDRYEKPKEIIKTESCYLSKLVQIQNIILFCQEMDNELVYEVNSNSSHKDLLTLLFKIPDRKKVFDSGKLIIMDGEYLYILEKKNLRESCIFSLTKADPTCYVYPQLKNDEILEYLNLRETSNFQEFNDFYFQTATYISSKEILIYGDAWRFGYGSYGILNLTTGTFSKLESKTRFNPYFTMNWNIDPDGVKIYSEYFVIDNQLLRYVINIDEKTISEYVVFEVEKILRSQFNFFITFDEKFFAIINNSEPHELSICDSQPIIKFGTILDSIIIKDSSCNRLLQVTSEQHKVKIDTSEFVDIDVNFINQLLI